MKKFGYYIIRLKIKNMTLQNLKIYGKIIIKLKAIKYKINIICYLFF